MEVRADEKHDEGKVEQVVRDEVTPHAGGRMDMVGIAGEEVADITKLQDEKDDPSES